MELRNPGFEIASSTELADEIASSTELAADLVFELRNMFGIAEVLKMWNPSDRSLGEQSFKRQFGPSSLGTRHVKRLSNTTKSTATTCKNTIKYQTHLSKTIKNTSAYAYPAMRVRTNTRLVDVSTIDWLHLLLTASHTSKTARSQKQYHSEAERNDFFTTFPDTEQQKSIRENGLLSTFIFWFRNTLPGIFVNLSQRAPCHRKRYSQNTNTWNCMVCAQT